MPPICKDNYFRNNLSGICGFAIRKNFINEDKRGRDGQDNCDSVPGIGFIFRTFLQYVGNSAPARHFIQTEVVLNHPLSIITSRSVTCQVKERIKPVRYVRYRMGLFPKVGKNPLKSSNKPLLCQCFFFTLRRLSERIVTLFSYV